MPITPNLHSVDLAYRQLDASGWSIGEVGTSFGWLVTGSHGDKWICASGATASEAWDQACRQAEAVGLLVAVF